MDRHSYLNGTMTEDDYFDDLAETEGADTQRLRLGWKKMNKLFHPDKW